MNPISQNTKPILSSSNNNRALSKHAAEREVHGNAKCRTKMSAPIPKESNIVESNSSEENTSWPQELTRKRVISAQQNGYILLMTMVLLIILTTLALTNASLNTTQTRIAANATETEISLEKTEGALNEAVNNLLNGTYNATNFLKNSNGLYILNPADPPLWSTANWSSATSVIHGFQGYSNTQSGYIIEQLPSIIQPGQNMNTPTRVYRITARSIGANGNISVMLQSTVQIQQ